MHISQVVKLPQIEKRLSAKCINQIMKSIRYHSLQRITASKGMHDRTPKRANCSQKKSGSKLSLEVVNKMGSPGKDKKASLNTLTTTSSRTQINRSKGCQNDRACQVRGFIAKIAERDSVVLQTKSYRQIRHRNSLDLRYQYGSKQSKDQDLGLQIKIKSIEQSVSSKIQTRRSQNLVSRRSKPKSKKPSRDLSNMFDKINRPLEGVSKQLMSYNFDEQIKPWSQNDGRL